MAGITALLLLYTIVAYTGKLYTFNAIYSHITLGHNNDFKCYVVSNMIQWPAVHKS